MLEVNKAQSAQTGRDSTVLEDLPERDLFAYAVGFARRQVWLVLLGLVIGGSIGTAILFKIKPNFTATATLLVDTRKYQITQQPTVVGQISFESSAAMDSQLEVLKSEKIALAVIKKLKLNEEPEFVKMGRGYKAILFGDMLRRDEPASEDELIQRALSVFAKRTTVKRIGITYAIDVQFESKFAERAAQIANSIADTYIEQQQQSQYSAMRQASDWLQGRLRELRGQSASAQQAVVEYKAQHNIIEMGGGRLVDEQRLEELNSRLAAAHTEAADAKIKLDQSDAMIHANDQDAVLHATIGDATRTEAIGKLRTQYLELASREADWSAKYGHDHLAVVNLRNQMRQLKLEIAEEFRRTADSLRSAYQLAQQREVGIRAELADAVSRSQTSSQAQVALHQLEVSAQTYKELYDNFLNRYTESLQQQTSPIAEATVITRASPPAVRNYKKTFVMAAIFPVMGLVLGFGIAVLRERAMRVFWTGRQVEGRLRRACLAVLPKAVAAKERISAQPLSRPALERRLLVRADMGVSWNVSDLPFSRFSEGVRAIKLAVDLSNRANTNKVVGFTSAVPNEGKSTISTAFALLVARTGLRVVVVDCDLRNPSLTRSIAPGATSGILELISDNATIDEIVWKDELTQMEFLPAVLTSPLVDSYDILASDAMRRVFEDLRRRYDLVVVDLSPLAPVIDVCATAHQIDSFVLVVEWGRTKYDTIEHALRSAPAIYDSMLGVILNKVDVRQLTTHDSNLTDYYYNKHYRGSGYSDT